MKTRSLFILTIVVLLVSSLQLFAQDHSIKIQTTSADSISYTCPMDPEIISNKPGKCPKCGMDLIQVSSSSSEHKMDMMMMCPMHGMVDMNHKHGKEKKGNNKMMKSMGIAAGVMMVVMMTVMIVASGSR